MTASLVGSLISTHTTGATHDTHAHIVNERAEYLVYLVCVCVLLSFILYRKALSSDYVFLYCSRIFWRFPIPKLTDQVHRSLENIRVIFWKCFDFEVLEY